MIPTGPRYTFNTYAYNPACHCDWCRNGGRNPNPLMVQQGGSYGYAEPHNPPKVDRYAR